MSQFQPPQVDPAIVAEDDGAICQQRTTRAPHGAIEIRIMPRIDRDGFDLFRMFIPPAGADET